MNPLSLDSEFFVCLEEFFLFFWRFFVISILQQRQPGDKWRTQPTIEWKWPKALRDYPVLLPDLGPGMTAAVPWISWNTFFTFTTWCCLYVSSIYSGTRARKKGIFYFGDTSTQERVSLTQNERRGPWNPLSRFTRESLLSLLSDGSLCTVRRSYFNPSLVFPIV